MLAVATYKKRRAACRRLSGEPLGHSPYGRANSTRGMVAPKRGGIEENGRLHPPQAVTTFSQVVRPPRLRGITWSKVKSGVGKRVAQY